MRDHPRSRGVYPPPSPPPGPPTGSSPLARGLPTSSTRRCSSSGIIPARAGFTRPSPRTPPRRADHPRSRGVYGQVDARLVVGDGSSPLARGLQRREVADAEQMRIIPARAGFTCRGRCSWSRRRDHPRSRGVYPAWPVAASPPRGSSPLARGLLARACSAPMIGRIIPARAGFTPARPLGGRGDRDHPRSRGVYRDASICCR